MLEGLEFRVCSGIPGCGFRERKSRVKGSPVGASKTLSGILCCLGIF